MIVVLYRGFLKYKTAGSAPKMGKPLCGNLHNDGQTLKRLCS